MTIDHVDQFDYVRYCWYEAMRLEPPVPRSLSNVFCKKVTIAGVDFEPGVELMLNFKGIQKDPREWKEPETYCPERFDPKSPWYLKPNGEPRSSFAFCPFFGGKRICLGKTLAEFMTTFTLPLVMHHLNFEYVNPEHVTRKPNFQIASSQAPVIPMRIRTIKKL